ncbi:MAG: hypothetical protein QM796_21470 [Chthoniobacteraceae bacterium]
MSACKLRGVEPSFLLHPLDFLGSDEITGRSLHESTWSGEAPLSAMGVVKHLKQHFKVLPTGGICQKSATFAALLTNQRDPLQAADDACAVLTFPLQPMNLSSSRLPLFIALAAGSSPFALGINPYVMPESTDDIIYYEGAKSGRARYLYLQRQDHQRLGRRCIR